MGFVNLLNVSVVVFVSMFFFRGDISGTIFLVLFHMYSVGFGLGGMVEGKLV